MLSRVAAGFPSPAQDYIERRLDLNEHLIRRPSATFFVRVTGESMTGAAILDGDLLIVDRSIEPRSGKIIIASLAGELTVKRLLIENETVTLIPENPSFSPIHVAEPDDFEIWGVVTAVIRETP